MGPLCVPHSGNCAVSVFRVLGTQLPHAWFWPLDGKLPLQ